MKKVKISIISDNYDIKHWGFIWNDKYCKCLYKELLYTIEMIYSLYRDSDLKLELINSMGLGVNLVFSALSINLRDCAGKFKDKIIVHALIPYAYQDMVYKPQDKNSYKYLLQHSDIVDILTYESFSTAKIKSAEMWKIENSDQIIMLTNDEDNPYINYARTLKVPIYFIKPKDIELMIQWLDYFDKYTRCLIENAKDENEEISEAKRIISKYAREVLSIEFIDYEQDKEITLEERRYKYLHLSSEMAHHIVRYQRIMDAFKKSYNRKDAIKENE